MAEPASLTLGRTTPAFEAKYLAIRRLYALVYRNDEVEPVD
jgi:hypothetical protein